MSQFPASVTASNAATASHQPDQRITPGSAFVAMLVHELRDPLLPLGNAIQLLSTPGINRSVSEQALAIMRRQVTQLTRLVEDMFDFARSGDDTLHLLKERIKVRTIVDMALEVSNSRIESARLRLHVDIRPPQLKVFGDQGRLAQAVANLLNNAARYTPRGGEIWLTCRRASHGTELSVRDSGTGIEWSQLAHVFEPFHQATGQSGGNRGLGLGLPIARRIVEMHGGSLTATSGGHGKGSTFTMTFPVHSGVD